MKTSDLYASVTQSIIRDLEQGAPTWIMPWKKGVGSIMPRNYHTLRPYSGINVLILFMEWRDKLYPTNEWLTYNQAVAIDGQVRKGERGTQIIYAGKHTFNKGADDKKTTTILKTFTVFNVAQIDGLPPTTEAAKLPPTDERLQTFVEATGAKVQYGGDRAFYAPSHDLIQLPNREAFYEESSYWATYLHELSHWTGHMIRLDRNLRGRFGDDAYAAEELVAELSAAFLCAYLDIKGELRHSGYIKTWIHLLKNDERAIFTAASHASRAADYIRNFSEKENDHGHSVGNGTDQEVGRTEVQATG